MPQGERIFVGDPFETTKTYVLRYHAASVLREIIDSTHFRGSDVFVIVLRSAHKKQPVFFHTVKRSEKPTFKLSARDVIWISPPGMPMN